MIDTSGSIFWKEIFQQPKAVADCIAANRDLCRKVGEKVKARGIKTAVLAGRGSSDHANLVGRYLLETKCGMVVSISAPSVVTAYKSAPDYSNVLMIAVSQSGASTTGVSSSLVSCHPVPAREPMKAIAPSSASFGIT